MGIKVRKNNQWVTVATASLGTGTTKVAQLWDQKTAGTDGGTFTAGSWVDRTLNTENDPQSFVTLESGNVSFSLLSGTYRITWSAPANNVHLQKTRLVHSSNSDFSAPVTTIQGSSGFDSSNLDPNSQTRSFGDTQLTITEKTYFKIQHRCTVTQNTYGFGGATGLAAEIYTQVTMEDLNTAAGAGGGGGGGVTDGDKGDITVTNSGATWTIDNDVIEEKHIDADGTAANGKVLEYYDGHSTNWRWADPGATVTTADSPPGSPSDGDLWWNSSTGILNVYYADGNSSQWVNATGRAGGAIVQAKTKIAVLRDQKNYDKNGGYFYGDYWRDRDLTVIEDPQGFVTFVPTANGQTTESAGKTPGYWSLPAGTYEIQWGAGGYDVNRHQTRLVWSTTQSDMTWSSDSNNNTADNPPDETSRFGTNQCFGSSENGTHESQGAWAGGWSTGTKIITITETTWFKVLHISDIDDADGFGTKVDNSNFASDRYTTGKNIYAEVRIVDLATAVKNTGDDYVAGNTRVATVKDIKAYDEEGGPALLGDNNRGFNTKDDPHNIGIDLIGPPTVPSSHGLATVVSIPAGTYSIKWSAPAFDVGLHNTQLQYSTETQFLTASTTKVQGSSEWTATAQTADGVFIDHTQSISIGTLSSVTFTQTTYVRLVHYCQAARGQFGLGCNTQNANYGDSVYAQIEIVDLATAVKNTGDDYVAGTTKVATVKDVKAYNVDGGTFTADTWVHRTLNTLSDPNNIGLSISGNIVTVPAGTYSIRWRAPAYLCNRFTSRLAYSTTSSTVASGITYVDGTTGYSHAINGLCAEESFGDIATITFSTTTYLKIEQYSDQGYTGGTSGLGVGSYINGVESIFTTLVIEDLATAIKGVVASGSAPASATSTGVAGTIAYDSSYVYICTATNTWKRVAISSW